MSNCFSRPLIIQSDLVVKLSLCIVTVHYHKCPPALGVRAELRTISHSLALGGVKFIFERKIIYFYEFMRFKWFIFTLCCGWLPRLSSGPARAIRLALVNSVWLGLSLWHGESYLIKISLYHTPRACQQFLTIRHLLLCLIGQTHNTYTWYMNCCSWWTLTEGLHMAWTLKMAFNLPW